VAHGNVRVEKWREKRRMERVASSLALYRTRSIQHYYRRCAYFGCQQPTELTPPPIKMDSSISLKDQIWFLRVCHHILFSLYDKISTRKWGRLPGYSGLYRVGPLTRLKTCIFFQCIPLFATEEARSKFTKSATFRQTGSRYVWLAHICKCSTAFVSV